MFELRVKDKIANFVGIKLKEVKGGYFGRERFRLIILLYKILPYLGFDYCRLVEWEFVLKNLPKEGLKVLDIGTSSSLFIYELAGRGYDTFGLDSRSYTERLPSSIKFFQCDVAETIFPDDFFDVLTVISVIEHVGLGAYGDPKYDDGDFKAMNEMKRILKSKGLIFITTIVAKNFTITPDGSQRIYDRNRLIQLMAPFTIEKEEYHIFTENRWRMTRPPVAFSQNPEDFGLACLMLRKS